jgi:hypothetical protein
VKVQGDSRPASSKPSADGFGSRESAHDRVADSRAITDR